jgi:hypothetical protein
MSDTACCGRWHLTMEANAAAASMDFQGDAPCPATPGAIHRDSRENRPEGILTVPRCIHRVAGRAEANAPPRDGCPTCGHPASWHGATGCGAQDCACSWEGAP